MTEPSRPTWVGQLELGVLGQLEPIGARASAGCAEARILIRLHGEPMGFVDAPIPPAGLVPEAVAAMAWERLAEPIRRHLSVDELPYLQTWKPQVLGSRSACRLGGERRGQGPISVVLCTRDRPEVLGECLRSLQRLAYPRFEVVTVDNASAGEATRKCFTNAVGADIRFRYVREPTPGLSVARNRGLAEALFSHIAFTDDDVIVDPYWLHGIAGGFSRRSDVGCVTGMVPSARLDNAAHRYFDRRVSWSTRLKPELHVVGATGQSALFPFDAGSFGTGANFAVDRSLVARLGGFDEALGAGSLARGGEDLDLFVRVLLAGKALAYEPSAIVWHRHRKRVTALQSQMNDFGVALGAYLAKQVSDRRVRRQVLRKAPAGLAHMLGRWRTGRGSERGSKRLILTEIWGIARGPIAYRRALRAVGARRSGTI